MEDCVVISDDEFASLIARPDELTDRLRALAQLHHSSMEQSPMWGVANGNMPLSFLVRCAQENQAECFRMLWDGAAGFAMNRPADDVCRIRVLLDFEQSLHAWNFVIDLEDAENSILHKQLLDSAFELYFDLQGGLARERLEKLSPSFPKVWSLCGEHADHLVVQRDGRDMIREEFKDGGAPPP